MRVLFVTHSFPRHDGDGAGEFILRLAGALTTQGCEVSVLAPSAPGLAPFEAIRAVPVTRFRYAPRSWETLAYAGTMAEQVAGSWRGKVALLGLLGAGSRAVARAVRDFAPDIVHAHWWFPGGVAAAFGASGPPLVVTLHGSDVRLAVQSRVAPAAFRYVARRAAAVTAVSSWLARTAESFAPGLSVSVVPMPVDATLFAAGQWPRRPTLLSVGRLNAQKGTADLLHLLTRMPPEVSADIVGDGPDRASLESLATRLGVGGRVRWHGHLPQDRVAPLYRQALATVMPSRDEGLGLVAAESLLAETPVVAYRSGGLVDLVDHGETGYLADEGAVAGLAAGVTSLLADPVAAARMGATGRARMLSRFSPETAAAAYLAVYRAVIR
jgi:glycosyltransferase involved in cell wall biosynthesis